MSQPEAPENERRAVEQCAIRCPECGHVPEHPRALWTNGTHADRIQWRYFTCQSCSTPFVGRFYWEQI